MNEYNDVEQEIRQQDVDFSGDLLWLDCRPRMRAPYQLEIKVFLLDYILCVIQISRCLGNIFLFPVFLYYCKYAIMTYNMKIVEFKKFCMYHLTKAFLMQDYAKFSCLSSVKSVVCP